MNFKGNSYGLMRICLEGNSYGLIALKVCRKFLRDWYWSMDGSSQYKQSFDGKQAEYCFESAVSEERTY